MTSTRDHIKLLLLQIRDEPRVRIEEHESFCRYGGLRPDQLAIHNVFDQPEFDVEIVEGYDALIVGGASEASVLEPDRYPFVPASIQLIRDCIAQDIPVFASCFGFQLAVLALGGEIIRDQADFEMGTIPISLSTSAREDILFRGLPEKFYAVSVHRERSVDTPPDSIQLAYTDQCCHAFKVNGRRFWAFQFHPEVDRQCLVERLTIFKDHYTDGEDHLNQVLTNAVETPHSNNLVSHFIDRVLL